MRIITSEFGHDYTTYSFGYTIHASLEKGDDIATVYAGGFLPYSGKKSSENIFYMARSVRITLPQWTPTSENRRVLKKFDSVFTKKVYTQEEIQKDETLRTLFLAYFKNNHGDLVMSQERYDVIVTKDLPLRGVCYFKNSVLVAAVLEVTTDSIVHFWFSCYETEYMRTSLGMYLILNSLQSAQENGCTYFYLGTAYGEKAKYKMNIETLEFWNGTNWVYNESVLKKKILSDADHATSFGSSFILP